MPKQDLQPFNGVHGKGGLASLASAMHTKSSLHSSLLSGGRSPSAPQHSCSKHLRRQRCTKSVPLCRAAVQEQVKLSPLQLERQFRQQIAEPASCSVTASGSDAAVHADGAQQGTSTESPAAAAASALRGDAPGNALLEADALASGEADSTQPSVDELAAALAALPHSVSSAAVLHGVWLDMQAICSLLTQLAKLRQPDRALATFLWFEQSPLYSIGDCLLYTRVISILGRHKRHRMTALRIFDRMQARRIPPDIMCFNTAIDVAGKAGQYGRAQQLFQQLQRRGFRPNVITYTALIAACQRAGKWQEAWRIFNAMEAAGVAPNVKTYTTLMSACTRHGQWQRALEAFRRMEVAGLQPDVLAYNSAISAYAAAGLWEKAWALFGTMKRLRMRPMTRSYNALLSACERAGQPDRALEVFANMQRAARLGDLQLKPTHVTYNTLLSACGKAGRFQETMRLYREMQAAGLHADVYTLTALMTACERVGKWDTAVRLLSDLRSAGVPTNLHHHNCLLNAYGRAGCWQKAVGKLQSMRESTELQPDAVSYNCVISACQRAGQGSVALQLFDEMVAAKLVPDTALFAMLITACERKGDWHRAIQLFNTMKELDVDAPSVSMAARQVMYAWPQLLELFPPALIAAAQATVASGRATRLWLDRRL